MWKFVKSAITVGTIVVLLVPTGGCGGSGGNDDVTLNLLSVGAVDGVVTSGGDVETTSAANIGDSGLNVPIRGFYRFDLSGIPAGATVVEATLITRQTGAGVFGTPYTDLGAMVVDHVNLGAALGPEDFASVAFTSAFAVISNNANLETKTAVVTDQVVADRAAARTTSDYRLRFATDTNSDNDGDFVQWATAEFDAGTGVFPTLRVVYRP